MIDATRATTSWRTVWRSIVAATGLKGIFASTPVATLPSPHSPKTAHPTGVIQAQVGHVSPRMMKTYGHIRRKALIEAAQALQAKPRLVREMAVAEMLIG